MTNKLIPQLNECLFLDICQFLNYTCNHIVSAARSLTCRDDLDSLLLHLLLIL